MDRYVRATARQPQEVRCIGGNRNGDRLQVRRGTDSVAFMVAKRGGRYAEVRRPLLGDNMTGELVVFTHGVPK